jgi:phospho-N-acetylmuramoyl-pentapeptide-transferase
LPFCFGPRVIAWLGQLGVGERIDGTGSATLEALHAHKKGTPTMGGMFIIGGIVLACALWMRFDEPNRFSLPGIFLIAGRRLRRGGVLGRLGQAAQPEEARHRQA